MPAPQNPHRLDRDKRWRDTETEYGFGGGLVPPGKEYATPADGGAYRGRAPSMVDPPSRRDVPGNPGEQIAR